MPVTTESLTLHSFGFWGEVGCKGPRMGITCNATCVSFHSASTALCKVEQRHSKGRCNSCFWEHSLVPHTPLRGSASPYHLAFLRLITAILFLSPRGLQKSVIKHAKKNTWMTVLVTKVSNKSSHQALLPVLGKSESQTKFWLGDFLFWVQSWLFIYSL